MSRTLLFFLWCLMQCLAHAEDAACTIERETRKVRLFLRLLGRPLNAISAHFRFAPRGRHSTAARMPR